MKKKCTIFLGTNKTDIYVWNKVSEYKNLPKALYSGVHSVNSNVHLKLLCMKDNVAFKTPNVHTCSKSTKKCHYPPVKLLSFGPLLSCEHFLDRRMC